MTRTLLLLALGAALAGCAGRRLVRVEDGPTDDGRRTTLLTTVDSTSYLFFTRSKLVFWECAEDPTGLVCKKACDVKDDQGDKVACQTTMGGL